MDDWPIPPTPWWRKPPNLVPWLLPIGVIGGVLAGLYVYTRASPAERQAAVITARADLAKAETQLFNLSQAQHAIVTQVHGEVLDDILSRKDNVSEAEKARMIDAALKARPEYVVLQDAMSQQWMSILHAKQKLADAERWLAK